MQKCLLSFFITLMVFLAAGFFSIAHAYGSGGGLSQVDLLLRQIEELQRQVLELQRQVLELAQSGGETMAYFAPTSLVETAVGGEVYQIFPRPQYNERFIEKEVWKAVNKERKGASLGNLFWSEEDAVVARLYTEDLAVENEVLTDETKPCSYPFIHHEGFSSGFTAFDRLFSRGVLFRSAGENILAIPLVESIGYRLPKGEVAADCPDLGESKVPDGLGRDEAIDFINTGLERREEVMKDLEPVEWVSRKWLSTSELVGRAVRGWMDSPGHRDNILHLDFTESGVGAVIVNDYIVMTQVFTGR